MVKQHAHGHMVQCSLPPTFFEMISSQICEVVNSIAPYVWVAIVFDVTHHLTAIKFVCQSISHTTHLI
jgi:hypothetical protein